MHEDQPGTPHPRKKMVDDSTEIYLSWPRKRFRPSAAVIANYKCVCVCVCVCVCGEGRSVSGKLSRKF